jgi:hypothetical protein
MIQKSGWSKPELYAIKISFSSQNYTDNGIVNVRIGRVSIG